MAFAPRGGAVTSLHTNLRLHVCRARTVSARFDSLSLSLGHMHSLYVVYTDVKTAARQTAARAWPDSKWLGGRGGSSGQTRYSAVGFRSALLARLLPSYWLYRVPHHSLRFSGQSGDLVWIGATPQLAAASPAGPAMTRLTPAPCAPALCRDNTSLSFCVASSTEHLYRTPSHTCVLPIAEHTPPQHTTPRCSGSHKAALLCTCFYSQRQDTEGA